MKPAVNSNTIEPRQFDKLIECLTKIEKSLTQIAEALKKS